MKTDPIQNPTDQATHAPPTHPTPSSAPPSPKLADHQRISTQRFDNQNTAHKIQAPKKPAKASKPPSSSADLNPIAKLGEFEQQEIIEKLLKGNSFVKVKEHLQNKCGLENIRIYEITKFWDTHCIRYLRNRNQRSHVLAKQITGQAGHQPHNWNSSIIKALQQRTFEEAISPEIQVNAITHLVAAITKLQDQKIQQKKIQLQTQKLQQTQADDTRERTSPLSPEEQRARCAQIFGIA